MQEYVDSMDDRKICGDEKNEMMILHLLTIVHINLPNCTIPVRVDFNGLRKCTEGPQGSRSGRLG